VVIERCSPQLGQWRCGLRVAFAAVSAPNRVTVAPETVYVPTSDSRSQFDLQVTNETDAHVFNVVVAFEAQIRLDLAILGPIDPDPGPKIQIGALEFFFGLLLLEWQPEEGPPQQLLYVSYLEPHSTSRIPLSISAPPKEDASTDRDVRVRVDSFSTERKPLRLRESSVFPGQKEALAQIRLPNGTLLWAGFVTQA
jgi:hypothetical protein